MPFGLEQKEGRFPAGIQLCSWWVSRGTRLLCTHRGAQGGTGCPLHLSFFRPLLLASPPSTGACTQPTPLPAGIAPPHVRQAVLQSPLTGQFTTSQAGSPQTSLKQTKKIGFLQTSEDTVVQDQDAPCGYLATPNPFRALQPWFKWSISSSPAFGDSPV